MEEGNLLDSLDHDQEEAINDESTSHGEEEATEGSDHDTDSCYEGTEGDSVSECV